jgi:ABC-type transport system involved in cytochrome c biogenesis permease subunit
VTATKLAPWLAGAVALAGALLVARAPGSSRGVDFEAFGHLPVLEGGRIKPIDSLARNSLLMLRGKQSLPQDEREVSADEWLLDVLFRPEVAATLPVFSVDDPDVLGLLGRKQTTSRYLSFGDLDPHLQLLQQQGEAAQAVDPKHRSRFQRAMVNLYERVILYHRLSNSLHLLGGSSLADEIANRAQSDADQNQRDLAQLALFRPLPPRLGEKDDAWKNVGEALHESAAGAVDPRLQAFARLEAAYRSQVSWSFNASVGEMLGAVAAERPELSVRMGREVVFNRAEPFYVGMVIYVLALLTVFISWLWRSRLGLSIAFGLLVAGALVHTTGLVSRIVLQGRPPVTNLYSSAVFVGFVMVLLGIILERVYRRGFGTGVAAAVGFSTLLVAHHLTGDGDTMEMMRAVLDSNFWLGTHVVTVTIGYSGTFLAGAIAVGYALRRHLVSDPSRETTKALVSMVYGTLCFSLFFSFVGTVLGGIWADQSWGRFWGWDPKENGALLIVLWNAIILHSRMGGFVRERGMMAMAIVGNVVTSLSWFGVNMLGIGLHSYGFMDKAFWTLAAFIGLQAVLVVLCVVPPLRLPQVHAPPQRVHAKRAVADS